MASEWYTFWYWTEGPGKGSGMGNPPAGGHGLLPEPPPLPPPPAPPPVVEPAKPPPVEQTFTNWGKVIPISMGMRRMSPMIIWLKNPVFIGVTPTADFCVSWGYNADDNPADTVCTALYANGTRIWTIGDGNLLPGSWDWTWYPGTETQGQDPTMVADKGAAWTPAYRNQMLGVFTNFPLSKFGFKLPGISAEIMGSGSEAPRNDSWNPADKHELVVLETPWTISKGLEPSGAFTPTGVRSRTFHKRGQYYLEIKADHLHTGAWYGFGGYHGVGLGVVLKTAPLTMSAGESTSGVGAAVPAPYTSLLAPPARRLAAGSVGSVEGPPQWNTGETMALHINMTEGYARARNVSQNSAWTAPLYYTKEATSSPMAEISLGDALYAYGNLAFGNDPYWGVISDKQTVNFGAKPFLGAIPAGATAWNGSGGTDTFLGTLPLKDFISKIALYCGLDPNADLDFVDIDDVIHGGIITQDTEFRTFLTVLGRAYGFDFYEGDVIRLIRRVVQASYTVDKAVPPEDLLTDNDRAITTTRRKDESPNEIELHYIDVSQQFRWNLQKARRILFPVKTTESKRKDSFSIPIVTTANDALTMAGKAMYREAAQNIDHECKLTSRHMDIEPSDILTLTAGDTQYVVKVAQISLEEDMRITLRAVNLLTDEDMEWTADAGEPALPWQGNIYRMVATEGADRMLATQFVGQMFAVDGADTFAGASQVLTLSAVEGADRFAGAQAPPVILAATEGADTFAGISAAADPYFSFVVLLSGFEGADAATAATDEATAKAITFVGNAQIDTAQKKFGASSLLLDGTGDYLTLADSADWNFGAGQFTLEAWVRFSSLSQSACIVAQAASSSQRSFYLYWNTVNTLNLGLSPDGSSALTASGAWSPSINTWYHVAADRDAAGKVRLYVNGAMIGSSTITNTLFNSTSPLAIGTLQYAAFDFPGWIDEVRITKDVARYASDSGYTTPTEAFPRSGPAVPSYSKPGGTGNRVGTITVTTTATTGGGTLSGIIDGALASNYYWASGQSGRELKFDFGSARLITEAKWYQDSATTHGTWKWQGSSDGSSWADIGGTFTLGGTAQVITTLSGNAVSYRYYRMLQTAGTTSSGPYLYEIEFKIL